MWAGCWVHIPAAAAQAEGWSPVAAKDAASTCAVEVIAPWKAVQALTPDATQMGDWKPTQVSSLEILKHMAAPGRVAG